MEIPKTIYVCCHFGYYCFHFHWYITLQENTGVLVMTTNHVLVCFNFAPTANLGMCQVTEGQYIPKALTARKTCTDKRSGPNFRPHSGPNDKKKIVIRHYHTYLRLQNYIRLTH